MNLLRAISGNRDLVHLEAVWACASLVRWALAILIALYAYDVAGVPAVGVAALARMLPAAVLAPRLAVIADRRSRRLVLLSSLAMRGLLGIAMAAVVWREGSLVLLLVLAAVFGAADSLQKPSQAALLGVHARNPTELAAANTLWSILDNAGFVVGALLVGVLVSLAGLAQGFAACVVPMVVAGLVTARMTPDTAHPPLPGTSTRQELLAGVRAIGEDRQLALLVGIFAVDMFVQAVVDVLLVVIALGLLDLGQEGAGWLSAAWGVGGVIGGVAATVLLARGRLAPGVTVGLVFAGLPLVGIGLWPDRVGALGLMGVLGLGFGVVEVALLILTQRLVAADVLARVYGAQETLAVAAMALGSVGATGLVMLAGEAGALVVAGSLLPLLAVGLVGRVRRLDMGTSAPDNVFEALRRVPAFATLPMATVETLAVRARRELLDADRDVVCQGEPGEAFYVIENGRVEVRVDGAFRRYQDDGEFFGEIALLNRVPRTASVRTVRDTSLLALDQQEFLAAVGAHPRTRHVLHETADERLAGHAPGSG